METKLGTFYREENNIAFIRIKNSIQIDVDVITNVISGALKCFPNENFSIIADVRGIIFPNVTLGALKHAVQDKELMEYCNNQAIIIDNLATSMIARYYAKIIMKGRNVRIFNNKSEAFKWIESQMNQNHD